MLVWRIVRPVHVANPLSGTGAARWGSRWNSVGTRMGYTSTSRALAVLEMLVHVSRENVPLDAVLVPIEVPDAFVAEPPELPEGWDTFPHSSESRQVGDLWVQQNSSLGMLIPSALLPAERNVLINPTHSKFAEIRVGKPEPGACNPRFFGMSQI